MLTQQTVSSAPSGSILLFAFHNMGNEDKGFIFVIFNLVLFRNRFMLLEKLENNIKTSQIIFSYIHQLFNNCLNLYLLFFFQTP